MIERTKETWFEADVHRIAGDLALKSPQPDPANAEASFERALAVARQQQAKSWELRAAMSLARLWRDQGKVQQAREVLVPVYGWFTEGFDTRDLKEAKALLDTLASWPMARAKLLRSLIRPWDGYRWPLRRRLDASLPTRTRLNFAPRRGSASLTSSHRSNYYQYHHRL